MWACEIRTDVTQGVDLPSPDAGSISLSKISSLLVYLTASKSYPHSILPAESYVQLIVDGLKVMIMGKRLLQEDCNFVIDSIIHAVKTRFISVHEFVPADLLLGYKLRRIGGEARHETKRAVVLQSLGVEQGKDLWEEEEMLAE